MPRAMLAVVVAGCALLGACSPSKEQETAAAAVPEAADAPAPTAAGEAAARQLARPDAGQRPGSPPAAAAAVAPPPRAARAPATRAREESPPMGFTPGETPYMETETRIGAAPLIDEMKGDRWEETVARFEADAMADQDAGELQRVYELALRETLAAHGLGLARFGCGLTLCAGTILGPLEDGGARYAAWQVEGIGLSTPFFVRYEADNAVQFEVRFTFSTDPSTRSITLGS